MNYILDKSKQRHGKNLELFKAPDVNTAIESIYTREYNPKATIMKSSPIEFDIPNPSADYISLPETRLDLELQILKEDGSELGDTDNVAFINLIAATVIKQLDVNVQQQNITSGIGANFAFKALLEALLLSTVGDQESWLEGSGYTKDLAKAMDKHDPKTSVNIGLKDRYKLTAKSKKAFFSTQLFVDFFNQGRLMINGVPMNIKLYVNNDKFCLMYTEGATNYTFRILSAKLWVTYVKINTRLLEAQLLEISKNDVLYPYTRTAIKSFTLSHGAGDWSMDNIFQDNIPDVIYVCMVDSDAYNGNIQKNPFNFKHNKINHIEFVVNGISQESHKFNPRFQWTTTDEKGVVTIHSVDDYTPPYLALFNGGFFGQPTHCPHISRKDFKYGYAIFKIDVTNKRLSEGYMTPMRKGQTRLTLRFAETLPVSITVLVYAQFNSIIKIDQARGLNVEL